MTRSLPRIALAALLLSALPAAQQPADQQTTGQQPTGKQETQPEQPRFRGGANLVRVDAYVTIDGAAPTDLAVQDFEVLEDNVPQKIESW